MRVSAPPPPMAQALGLLPPSEAVSVHPCDTGFLCVCSCDVLLFLCPGGLKVIVESWLVESGPILNAVRSDGFHNRKVFGCLKAAGSSSQKGGKGVTRAPSAQRLSLPLWGPR